MIQPCKLTVEPVLCTAAPALSLRKRLLAEASDSNALAESKGGIARKGECSVISLKLTVNDKHIIFIGVGLDSQRTAVFDNERVGSDIVVDNDFLGFVIGHDGNGFAVNYDLFVYGSGFVDIDDTTVGSGIDSLLNGAVIGVARICHILQGIVGIIDGNALIDVK